MYAAGSSRRDPADGCPGGDGIADGDGHRSTHRYGHRRTDRYGHRGTHGYGHRSTHGDGHRSTDVVAGDTGVGRGVAGAVDRCGAARGGWACHLGVADR